MFGRIRIEYQFLMPAIIVTIIIIIIIIIFIRLMDDKPQQVQVVVGRKIEIDKMHT